MHRQTTPPETTAARMRRQLLKARAASPAYTADISLEHADWPHTAAPEDMSSTRRVWVPQRVQHTLQLVLALVLGGAIAGGIGWAMLRMPYQQDGIDRNSDGVLDEKWTRSPTGRLLRTEIDRNLDGAVDWVQEMGARGDVVSHAADDDFNGTMETTFWYSKGIAEMSQVDSDGDGYAEIRAHYPHGVLATKRHINPRTHKDVRIEHYRLGVLVFAITDSNNDGVLDQRVDYSPLGEVLRTGPLKPGD